MEKNTARTERIMSSLDGLVKAGAPDFFYTRLTGRMQREPEKEPGFILRPVFITATLSVLLLVNIISFVKIGDAPRQPGTEIKNDKPATIESFASAYNMNTESVYE